MTRGERERQRNGPNSTLRTPHPELGGMWITIELLDTEWRDRTIAGRRPDLDSALAL